MQSYLNTFTTLVETVPFLSQELSLSKKYSKCYSCDVTVFFSQVTPNLGRLEFFVVHYIGDWDLASLPG